MSGAMDEDMSIRRTSSKDEEEDIQEESGTVSGANDTRKESVEAAEIEDTEEKEDRSDEK